MVSRAVAVTFICGYLLAFSTSTRAQEEVDLEPLRNEVTSPPVQTPLNLDPSTIRDLDSLINQLSTKPNQGQPTTPSAAPVTKLPVTSPPVQTPLNLDPITMRNLVRGPDENDCTCVAWYLCNNGTLNKYGENVTDIRMDVGNPCVTYMEVCCKDNDTRTEPLTPPAPTAPTGCGYRNTSGTGFRITGAHDSEAQFGEFPWMVAILKKEDTKGNNLKVYQCGGALINPQAVLTSAHCVDGKGKTFTVRAGEWDNQHGKEIYPYQDRQVETIEIHPYYKANALHNDIAVLILRTPVDTAPHISNICLPSQDEVIETGRGFATGWGKDQLGKKGKYQVILKKIDLPVVSRATCQEKLRTTRLGRFFWLDESFICAGGEPGKDMCRGDGGSPLVVPVSTNVERYIQAGIVAWGIGCGENGIPGVYVNVAKFRNWIDEKMRSHDLDTSTYQY